MIANQMDRAATTKLRRLKIFDDPRSYVSISGHVYLEGWDRTMLRERVFAEQKACALCLKPLAPGQGDLEHIKGGLGPQRCDCYRTRLADGTRHTNVQRTHSMRDPMHNCHRVKHHREVEK
jgi:hypothetical protein